MKRHHLSKSDIKELCDETVEKLGEEAKNLIGNRVEIAELKDFKLYLSKGEPVLIKSGAGLFPFLSKAEFLPRVTIDMGAVKPISGGADVMAPGIVSADKASKGEIVAIEDEKNRKIIAIGKLFKDRAKAESGEVVKNLHHCGDKFWKISAKL